MINLNRVVPGDILYCKGDKCRVDEVTCHRLRNMDIEVTAITVRFLEGSREHSDLIICSGGFKYLEATAPRKFMNAKVVCIWTSRTRGMDSVFKVGKIYDVKDGLLELDGRYRCPGSARDEHRFETLEDINQYFSEPAQNGNKFSYSYKFIEVVE